MHESRARCRFGDYFSVGNRDREVFLFWEIRALGMGWGLKRESKRASQIVS